MNPYFNLGLKMTEVLNSRRRINNSKLKEPDKVGRLFALIGWVSGAAVASSVVIYTSQSVPETTSTMQMAARSFKSPPFADSIETGSIPSSIGKKTANTMLLSELKQINQTNALLRAHSMSLARRLTFVEKKLAQQNSENTDFIETGSIARSAKALQQTDYSSKARVIVTQRPFDPHLDIDQPHITKQAPLQAPVIAAKLDHTDEKQIAYKILHQNIVQKNATSKRATQTQFGIDLGSSKTLSEISHKWSQLSSKAPKLLANLKPLATIHEHNDATILHLIVGPFSNAEDTEFLCAKLRPDVSNCSTVTYEGQKISIQ